MSQAADQPLATPDRLWSRAFTSLYGAVIAILTSVVASLIAFYMTKGGPEVDLVIERPTVTGDADLFDQRVLVRNTGGQLAKDLRMLFSRLADRHRVMEIKSKPPLLRPCKQQPTADRDLYLLCGDLHPNGWIVVRVQHLKPRLLGREIDAFIANAPVKKIAPSPHVAGARG